MSDNKKTIQDMTDELEQLLAWFESDDVTVEHAVEKYKAATELTAAIEERLKTAKNEIKLIKKKYSEA